MTKQKQLTPEQKVAIVRRHLVEKVPVVKMGKKALELWGKPAFLGFIADSRTPVSGRQADYTKKNHLGQHPPNATLIHGKRHISLYGINLT